ncbi:hypothetical protein KI387_007315, partial [Taxus chinensis]
LKGKNIVMEAFCQIPHFLFWVGSHRKDSIILFIGGHLFLLVSILQVQTLDPLLSSFVYSMTICEAKKQSEPSVSSEEKSCKEFFLQFDHRCTGYKQ